MKERSKEIRSATDFRSWHLNLPTHMSSLYLQIASWWITQHFDLIDTLCEFIWTHGRHKWTLLGYEVKYLKTGKISLPVLVSYGTASKHMFTCHFLSRWNSVFSSQSAFLMSNYSTVGVFLIVKCKSHVLFNTHYWSSVSKADFFDISHFFSAVLLH